MNKVLEESPFQKAVSNTPDISQSYCKGLQALKNREKEKLRVTDSSKIDGSVDIDNAVKSIYPTENRWDYVVGYDNKVCFIEVHPAYTSEVSTMEAKLAWLKKWLKEKAPLLNNMPKTEVPYVWIQTKGSYILPQSKEARKVSLLGIKMVPLLQL